MDIYELNCVWPVIAERVNHTLFSVCPLMIPSAIKIIIWTVVLTVFPFFPSFFILLLDYYSCTDCKMYYFVQLY